tara:strand:- start:97 stop:705 length:609 start_codon:yes stop_codon:yes gene_type:complete
MKNIFLKDNEINKALINSIVKNGWDGSWFTENDYIVIETNNNHKINKKLEYYEGQRLCICLGIQLEVLAKFNKSFLFFDLDDISVINEQWYIINSYDETNNKVVSVDSAGASAGVGGADYITITNPVNFKSEFMAPELINFYKDKNKNLPFVTNISCIYYSVALLILHYLELNLEDLLDSPLYYFLKRCMEKDENNRFFIFV